MLMCCTL